MNPNNHETGSISLKDRFMGTSGKVEAFNTESYKHSKELQENKNARDNRAAHTATAEFYGFRLANPAYGGNEHPEYENGVTSSIRNAEWAATDSHANPVALEMTDGRLSTELGHDSIVKTVIAKIKETYGENPTFYDRISKGLEKLDTLFSDLENSPFQAPQYRNKEAHLNILKQIDSQLETLKQFAVNVATYETDPKVLDVFNVLGVKLSAEQARTIKDHLKARLDFSTNSPAQDATLVDKPLTQTEYNELITKIDSITE